MRYYRLSEIYNDTGGILATKGYQSKWAVFSMSVPIFIETALQMMVPNIDQFMLSRYSQNSVAAVGNDNVIFNLVILSLGGAFTGCYDYDFALSRCTKSYKNQ